MKWQTEEKIEDELEENFHSCFEDENDFIANADNDEEFKDEDFV